MKLSFRHILTTLLLETPLSVCAQANVQGTVLEYHGTAQKTPLHGVEIQVQDAASTVSGSDGSFQLLFRKKKKGDAVVARRIEKIDYEIFNTEALQQWNIGDTFTIVMCKRRLFKSLRDNYFKVSSKSYARQYQTEQDKLKKQRKANQLKEQEYQQQLSELNMRYQEQLENLDTYAEYFARIDLSELSPKEQHIIDLVQKGRIEEAIEEYEKMDYLKKYKNHTSDIQRIDSVANVVDDMLQSKTRIRDSISSVKDINSIE